MQNVSISSFYHFIEIQNVEDIRDALLDFCVNSNLLEQFASMRGLMGQLLAKS